MAFRRKLFAPVVLGLALVLGACGGDDSTGPVELNATELSNKLTQMTLAVESEEILELQQLATLFTLGGSPAGSLVGASLPLFSFVGDPFAGSDLLAQRDQVRALLDAVPDFSNAAPAVVIPAEYHGTVYVYNTSTNQYEASAETGAPSDGVRFRLYAVDPVTNLPAEPLNQTGYIDLRDLSTTTTNILSVTAVSGATTFADYEISVTETATSATVMVDGFIGQTTSRLDVTLQFSVTASSESLDSDVSLPGQNFRVLTKLDVTDNGSEVLTLDITIQLGTQNVRLAGSATDGAGTLTFTVNGQAYATVTLTGGGEPVIEGSDGRTLEAGEIDAIATVIFVGVGVPFGAFLIFIAPIAFLFAA